MNSSKAKPASTPDELKMVFASLGTAALLEHLRSCAMFQRIQALQAAFDMGLLDIREDLENLPKLSSSPTSEDLETFWEQRNQAVDAWAYRICSFTSFLENAAITRLPRDPSMPMATQDPSTFDVHAKAGFADLFDTIANDIADQVLLLRGTNEDHLGSLDRLPQSLSRLTAGAIALNLPSLVHRLATVAPEIFQAPIKPQVFGETFAFSIFDESVRGKHEHKISISNVALQFSRIECLDALKAVTASNDRVPPTIHVAELSHATSQHLIEHTDLSFAENLISGPIQFWCSSAAFHWALVDAWSSTQEGAREKLITSAFKALEPDNRWRDFVHAFLEAGCYDLHANAAVYEAARHGWPAVITGAGRPTDAPGSLEHSTRAVTSVDWVKLCKDFKETEAILDQALAAIDLRRDSSRDNQVKCALAVLARAKDEGGLTHAIGAYATEGSGVPQPIATAIWLDLPQVVIALLDGGIHPDALAPGASVTPMDIAKAEPSPTMMSALRAWMARASANRNIDTLDITPLHP